MAAKKLDIKKLLVVGCTGYVGNNMIKTFARAYPHIQVVGMSRRGGPRENATAELPNVSFVKGDCLEPETF